MSKAEATTEADVANKLGLKDGDLVQEFGYDDDVDFDLRDEIEDAIGSEMLTDDDHDVVDALILWWREGDGDLVDALMDCQFNLAESGDVWVLTPKSGRDGYVPPVDVQQAAPTAGLHSTSTAGVSTDWAATRLVAKRSHSQK